MTRPGSRPRCAACPAALAAAPAPPEPQPPVPAPLITGTGPGNQLEPGVCREQAGRALVQSRRERGLTQQQAARALGWSLSKLLRIEAGTSGINDSDLHAALALYQAGPAQAALLTRLAHAGNARPWYRRHPGITPALGTYLQAERSAAIISGYRIHTVPALLQTPDYTRAVLAARHTTRPAAHAALTAARQELLTSGHCPAICYVIDQAALLRPPASPAIMAAQLTHLQHTAATHPRITIRITPLTAGAVPPAEVLTLITYPDGTAAAWHSTADGGHTRHDPATARQQMAYLQTRSVPPDAL